MATKGYNDMATLAEIRAKLQQQETRSTGSSNQGGDRAVYAHWNIPEGTTAKLRFLPDGNTKNDFFWVERSMIRLPFQGIKGQMDSKPVMVQVPCVEMYNDGTSCPILGEVRSWFKDPSLEDMGRKYWKKRSYVFQGFVRETPMVEDQEPENLIRRFIISPQIFNVIKSALIDTEIEELPTDYERGLDFWVTKTTKGQYADYSTSKWARKETALNNTELDTIESNGLFNLDDFLPKKPSETEMRVLQEMFEASVDGQPYDPDAFAQYYKPAGLQYNTPSSVPTPAPVPAAPAPAPAPVAEAVTESVTDTGWKEVEQSTAPAASSDAPAASADTKTADILAMIRQRKGAD